MFDTANFYSVNDKFGNESNDNIQRSLQRSHRDNKKAFNPIRIRGGGGGELAHRQVFPL